MTFISDIILFLVCIFTFYYRVFANNNTTTAAAGGGDGGDGSYINVGVILTLKSVNLWTDID